MVDGEKILTVANVNLTHLKWNNNNAYNATKPIHALHSIERASENGIDVAKIWHSLKTNKYNLIVLIIGSVSAKITFYQFQSKLFMFFHFLFDFKILMTSNRWAGWNMFLFWLSSITWERL